MRIKSPFKDYYDGLQHSFFSQEPLYVRKTTEEPYDGKLYAGKTYISFGLSNGLTISYISIGFCGKVYNIIRFHREKYNIYSHDTCSAICYNIDDVDKFIGSLEQEVINWYHRIKWKKSLRQEFMEYFVTKNINDDELCSYQMPVFVIEPDGRNYKTLISNPRLTNYEFFRVFDPYQTWQELEMFLSNQAAPEKPIPKIDDKTMAEAKGFNKYSFRKDKKHV